VPVRAFDSLDGDLGGGVSLVTAGVRQRRFA
jgi:hypothetical protein